MHANIWIRKEDEERWQQLENKAEFIHQALNGVSSKGRTGAFGASNLGSSPNVPTILGGRTVQDPSPVEQALLDSLLVVPGCCLLKTPCKHWVWQGEQMAYVNTISGEVRSVEL